MVDRKLSMVYAHLDNGVPKQALKACDALLKKHNNPLIHALKAIALDRMGRDEDALATARLALAAATAPSSPFVIDAHMCSLIAMTMRSAGGERQHKAEIAALYEAAVSRGGAHLPDDEMQEMQVKLFVAYGEAGDHVKAQRTAMSLHKRTAAPEFLAWAMTSLVFQCTPTHGVGSACQTPTPPPTAMPLALAAGLGKKIFTGAAAAAAAATESELELFASVLAMAGKPSAALELLQSDAGKLVKLPTKRAMMQASCAFAAGDLDAAAEYVSEVLRHDPNDVRAWNAMLDAVAPDSMRLRSSGGGGFDAFSPALAKALRARKSQAADGLPSLGPEHAVDVDYSNAILSLGTQIDRLSERVPGAIELVASTAEAGSAAWPARLVALMKPEAALRELRLRRRCRRLLARLADAEMAPRILATDEDCIGGAAIGAACDDDVEEKALIEGIVAYIGKHGHLPSMPSDLFALASALSPKGRRMVTAHAFETATSADEAAATDDEAAVRRAYRRLANAWSLGVDLGIAVEGGADDLTTYNNKAAEAVRLGRRQLIPPLVESSVDPRDQKVGDGFAACAAATLIGAARKRLASEDEHSAKLGALASYAASAAALEEMRANAEYSAVVLVPLACIYGYGLGCPKCHSDVFQRLDVKQIQLDSIAIHLTYPVLCAYEGQVGRDGQAKLSANASSIELFSGTSASYYAAKVRYVADSHMRDESQSVSYALEHGNFVQLLDFANLRSRLNRSYAVHASAVEKAIHSLTSLCPPLTTAKDSANSARAILDDLDSTLRLSAEPQDAFAEASLSTPWRFNLDLAQRPPWLPLGLGGPRQAVMEHWEVVTGSTTGSSESMHADAWSLAEEEEGGPWRGDLHPQLAGAVNAGVDARGMGWGSMRRARFPLEGSTMPCALARHGLGASLARRIALAYYTASALVRAGQKHVTGGEQENDAPQPPPLPALPASPSRASGAAATCSAIDACITHIAAIDGDVAKALEKVVEWLRHATFIVESRLVLRATTAVALAPDIAAFARRLVSESIPLLDGATALRGGDVKASSGEVEKVRADVLSAVVQATSTVRPALGDAASLAASLRAANSYAVEAVDSPSAFDEVCKTLASEHASLAELLERDAKAALR
ncbi:hypothetical protein PPROV_000561700 [Pycnococcus provasolii]|uniref:N-terminal acetyltransferase B complex subunit NAA25 homolog n=1 Tax=Pycnococcus provasolii TaxID=41880 RepID=A0A830HJV3_9CHLO|nr:hypothetical protein PPROV_000561700 [Pycnococcus provasolii]